MGTIIEVGAIDDDRLVLAGLAAQIASVGDVRLTETASTVSSYLEQPRAAKVVLLDLNLRDFSDPRDNVERLVAAGYKVIVMSVMADKSYIIATTEAGASAYLTKESDLAIFLNAIRAVANDVPLMTTEHAFWLSRDDRAERPRLSRQEAKILALYATGMSLKSVAQRLGVSYHTARTYLDRIRMKYESVGRPINSRVDYLSRAREDGLAREGLDTVLEASPDDLRSP